MSLIYYLQQEAARCRRLAASVDDVDLSHRLRGLAERFENRAAALNAMPGGVVPPVAGGQAPSDPDSATSSGIDRATDDIIDRMRARG
jgi:hypothetical protein